MADGTITLSTKIDEGGINSGLSKIKSGAAKLGKTFAVVGGAATAAFTAISKSAVDSYADYEQLVGGVETLFKKSSDVVMNYASQAYETAGMSANMYMETVTGFSASLLQSLGGDTAKAAEYGNQAVIDMSDNANKMGTDIQRIQDAYQGFAKQNFTMLDNLKLGYGGTKTEMERLLADAEKIKKANGEMASYSIDSFADITEAIHVVQTEMDITGTTSKEAATTIQGSIGMMKGAWENLLTGLSDTNADVEDLMNKFIDSVETVFDNLEPVIEKTLSNLPQLVTKLGTKLIDAIPSVFNKIVPKVLESVKELFKAIVNTLSDNAETIADTFVNMGKALIDAVVSLIPQMISAGGKLVKGLIKGISKETPGLSTAAMSITAVFAAIKITNVVKGVVSGFNAINAVLKAYTVATAASQNVSVLLASTMTPLQLAVGVLTGKIELATAAQTLWNAVMNLNPAVLITTAIVGLTAAVGGAIVAYDNYIEEHSTVVQATKAMAEASAEAAEKAHEQADAMTNLTQTAAQTILDAEAESYANGILADELYNLAEQTNLTASQKERMRDIVEELNGNIDGLNLQLNEETGQLNMTRDALNEYITKSLEMAKAKAVQDMYTESLKEQYKAQSNMKEAANDYYAAAKRLTDIEEEWGSLWNAHAHGGKELTKEIGYLEDVLKSSSSAFKTNANACQDSQNKMQNIADLAGVELPNGFQIAVAEFGGMTQGMIDKCTEVTQQSEGLGQDFGTGYGNGIVSKNSEIYMKAYNLAREAVKGVKAGQKSNSPSKETAKLGKDFDDGYEKGIKSGYDNVKKAGGKLAKLALEGAKSNVSDVKTAVSDYVKALTEDSRTEVQKVVDESNEVLLDSEIKYNEEYERLKDSQSEADKKYLENLKATAEQERKLYDARLKDIENFKTKILTAYKDIATSALDSIEELKKSQESLEKKLSDYGGLTTTTTYEKKNGKKYTETTLADLDAQTSTLEGYYEMLEAVKKRGNVPKEFFSVLRDMGIEEGLEYADMLLELSDEDFANYIKSWEKKQETSKAISKALYADEAEELKNTISDKFTDATEEFFGLGGEAMNYFEEGFMDNFVGFMESIKYAINSAFSGVTIGGTIWHGVSAQSAAYAMPAGLEVPALARGGVVPRSMLVQVGERGREAVLPLENNTGWMDVLADKVAQRNSEQNTQVIREEHYNLNETELMRVIYKLTKGGERLNGTSLVDGGVY